MSELKDRFFELFEDMLDEAGKNRTAGTIYAHILEKRGKITQHELQKDMNLSSATISRCINVLEEKGRIIRKSRIKGTRKLEYEIPKNSFINLTLYPLRAQELQYTILLNTIDDILEEFRSDEENINLIKYLSELKQQITSVRGKLSELLQSI